MIRLRAMRVLRPAILSALALMPLLTGQESQAEHRAQLLKRHLDLSDSQLSRLMREPARSSVTLTAFQKNRLDEATAVLQQAWVYEAVRLGLIGERLWPGAILCYDEISSFGLQLSPEQYEKLRKLPTEPIAPRRGVLTDFQARRLASFEARLELVNAAIDLGLISKPTRGEPLCH